MNKFSSLWTLALAAISGCAAGHTESSTLPLPRQPIPAQKPVVKDRSINPQSSLSHDTMTLGTPLMPSQWPELNNWEAVQPIAGHEAHNVWTNPANTADPSFLMLNQMNADGKIASRAFPVIKSTSSSYSLAGGSISDPQFSPDGRYLLFKFGQIASPGTYRIYVVDTKTGQTQLACAATISYYAVSWSPDGSSIAFATGGAPDPRFYDFGRTSQGKLQLTICDWRTGKTQLVADNVTLRGPWHWQAAHTLLYGALAAPDEAFLKNPRRESGVDFVNGQAVAWERLRGGAKRKPVTPNVYAYSVQSRTSRLIVRDAYLPVASPDGKSLAFFGSADLQRPVALRANWKEEPSGSFVIVANADGTKRLPLSRHNGVYPGLIWSSKRRLLVLQQTARSPNARLEIKEWNIDTQKSRLVATLKATDPIDARSPNDPTFQALSLDADGKHLMVRVDEYYLLEGNKGALNQDTLQDVNLENGRVTNVARIRAASGVAWRYD